jgi:predicted RNA methylase
MPVSASAAPAAALPLFLPRPPADKISGLIHAATLLAQLLGQNRALDSRSLRSAMEAAFGGTDADGAWVWKEAYEALEAAQVLFLRKFGAAMRARAGSAAAMLDMLARLAARLPSQTRRSEESERLQQFSTPVTLGFVAAQAAILTPADIVLEPSAGTGLLAIFAELEGSRLVLNEIADTRAGLLGRLFREIPLTRHNAENIHDRLDAAIRPTVVLMNPPFSASPKVEGRFAEAAMRHVSSALARLAEGGRLVAITGHNVGPEEPGWRESFTRLQEKGRVVFSAAIAGQAYVRHGTTMDTRLTVIDRIPAENPHAFPPSPGRAVTPSDLLAWVIRLVPPRPPVAVAPSLPAPSVFPRQALGAVRPKAVPPPLAPRLEPEAVELAYETRDWTPDPSARLTTSLYEGYALQSIHTSGRPAKRGSGRVRTGREREPHAGSHPFPALCEISHMPAASAVPASISSPDEAPKPKHTALVADPFCGAGGSSSGAGRALARLGYRTNLLAVHSCSGEQHAQPVLSDARLVLPRRRGRARARTFERCRLHLRRCPRPALCRRLQRPAQPVGLAFFLPHRGGAHAEDHRAFRSARPAIRQRSSGAQGPSEVAQRNAAIK